MTKDASDLRSQWEELSSRRMSMMAAFLASKPIGSFIPVRDFTAVFGSEYVDYRALQDYLIDEFELSVWVVRPADCAGYIIIRADAQDQLDLVFTKKG